MSDHSTAAAANPLLEPLLAQLRRHPKRVVFTDGEDPRVLEAAARHVVERTVAPVLLGNRERIRALAAEHGIPLKYIHLIDPPQASDFGLFCQRVENMARYRAVSVSNPAEIVSRPHYFGALMVQYGQADAIVGGNRTSHTAFYRAMLQTIKPLPEVPKMFAVSILWGHGMHNFGAGGVLFLADTGLVPQPTIDELAAIAVKTGKLARHLLGRPVHVAMLSHSTRGSANTPDAEKMAAAAALARSKALQQYLEISIDGEVQADVALDPAIAAAKSPGSPAHPGADVLIFPTLDAADISLKLLKHCTCVQTYGQIILGLARPAAHVSLTTTPEAIFGVAATVAVEAIKYHMLHPEGDY